MITEQLLENTFKTYKGQFEGLKQDYFAPLFISKKHDRDFDKVVENCVFGNRDYGIDGFYLDKEARNLYIYQFKWSNSHELFKESYKALINRGMDKIFGDTLQDSKINPTVLKLKNLLDEYRDVINKVFIRFVFNGDSDKAQQSKALENLREDLENKKYLIDKFFEGRPVFFYIEYHSNTTSAVVQTSKTNKTHKYTIGFSGSGHITAPMGEEFHLGFISLQEIVDIYQEMKQRLFEKNIRAGLDADRAPNKAIKKTLKEILIDGSLAPEYFSFNHNGITLFTESLEKSSGQLTVIEPRILNGAQTITTFARFLEENSKHPALAKSLDVLPKIKVLAKVVTNCSPSFVTTITISNNRQNPVDAVNLRASDEIQFDFEDKFRDELRIFYERQENAFENMLDSDLDDRGITEQKQINIKKLAQTFLALQGEIDRMSRITEVFEIESQYATTFKKEYLNCNADKILTLYKVQLRMSRIIRDIAEKGGDHCWWASKAKNIIWALIIQGVLNDKHFNSLVQNHGQTLSVATNFSDHLRSIATKKVRLILVELLQQRKYADFMKKDQYAFFRTKVAYQEAMQIANRKYGWEKRSI